MAGISNDNRARLRHTLAAGASAAVLALWSGPALAQDDPDDETAAAAAEGSGEAIYVTGSRLATTGMDIPAR